MISILKRKRQLKPIKLFLIYTFSITWSSWILIIFANNYFNTLENGTPLFWIPYTIGSLGPAISAYIIYQKYKEDFAGETFSKYFLEVNYRRKYG